MIWLKYFAIAWCFIAVATFFFLLRRVAPFGRHTENGWGWMIDNRVGWIMMEIVSPIVFTISFFLQNQEPTLSQWILIGLWNLHYINRSLFFPFRIRTKGKKMPLVIALSAIGFNLVNGFLNGTFLALYAPEFSAFWWIGGVLFIVGFLINNWADTKLINLRRPNETGYKIPTGGLFEFISCPNLFGELIEWIGFGLMAMNIGAFSFTLWTFANLFPRALDHHKWYLDKFNDYPKARKAVVPFVV